MLHAEDGLLWDAAVIAAAAATVTGVSPSKTDPLKLTETIKNVLLKDSSTSSETIVAGAASSSNASRQPGASKTSGLLPVSFSVPFLLK